MGKKNISAAIQQGALECNEDIITGNQLQFDNHSDSDLFKLQTEILQLRNSMGIKDEIIEYLRSQLTLLESNNKSTNTTFFSVQDLRAHERLSDYSLDKKKLIHEGPALPKLYLRKQLLRKFPLLTPADIEMCILLSIGLTNKEITIITGKAHSTIENIISNLRTKINMQSQDIELKSYLFNLEMSSIIDTTNEFSIGAIMNKEGIILSSTECRVSSYLLMKLKNNDICNAMSISIRTLESHKYRIKKKLKLHKDQSLPHMLYQMLGKYL